jgi:predicted glycosyltransferase
VRILCHAQHLSGVGHFIRMHALACGLSRRHEVHLVAGGRPVPRAPDPADLRLLSLSPLARSGGRLIALEGGVPVAAVLADRAGALARAVEQIRPDAVLIDHYPFSKWELEGEIDATIEAARRCNPAVRVLCSLRDVVRQTRYEKADRAAYEERVLAALRSRFDGILVHADPSFTRIEEHFERAGDLPVPVAYTGFVVAPSAPAAVSPPRQTHAVLSCGGGSGALAFLLAAAAAFRRLADEGAVGSMQLVVFTGTFARASDLEALAEERGPIRIRPFGPEFAAALAGSALSISRAGYNTCAALLRSRTRAVLAPDPAMSDQESRAQRFAQLGLAQIVDGDPPAVDVLAAAIRAALAGPPPRHDFDLEGIAHAEALIAGAVMAARLPRAP